MPQPRLNPQRQRLALAYFLRLINSRASLSDQKRERLAAWARGYFKIGVAEAQTKLQTKAKGGRPSIGRPSIEHGVSRWRAKV